MTIVRRKQPPGVTARPPIDARREVRGPSESASEPLDGEQRRRMAECCAFFSAERYREAGPGELRESDIEAAEKAIDAAWTGTDGGADRDGRDR